ncbi:hypothetical protein GCM10027592_46910 [Spirosoma flavus]
MNELFTDRNHILELLLRADNKDVTRNLTTDFQQLRKERTPFYLTLDELNKVLKWKLRGQHGRQQERRKTNTDENVITITKAAFSVSHEDSDIETVLRLKLLCTLSGIEIPVASAILTLCFPEQYSVIDFRNWRQLYGETVQKTVYTPKEYVAYLKLIRSLAEKFDVTPQDIDIAIWQNDIERKKKAF